MISDKNPFLSLFTLWNIFRGHLVESPRWGDSTKYPRHMFFGIFITTLFNFSNNWFHLGLKIRFNQICRYNEFCRYTECRYKEGWLYLAVYSLVICSDTSWDKGKTIVVALAILSQDGGLACVFTWIITFTFPVLSFLVKQMLYEINAGWQGYTYLCLFFYY